ncbi:MAG TPA: TetR/AcrR family transcriptional regulator C-terminal domain-containing protein [Acidimicrobiales bacterium]|jgi:AcrR family transcriptional regulator|nr:TetR/AcrR family transcriptional regulator C-terminal domain-containing protein [Acidimicrobiales bacterium]
MTTGPARTTLSRERVLRAALDLVDREGADALTMRRLGRALGVEAMSLYGYVRSKDDLINGVVELIFGEMPLVVPGPEPWQERVHRHADIYRSVLLAHPNAVRLVAGRPLVTERTAAFVESALADLRSIGLDVETADRVLGVIAGFTLGLVSEQTGAGRRTTSPGDVLDLQRFPHLADMAALGAMTPDRYDAEFELGLDFIVGGIERLLAEARTRRG